MIYIKNSLSQWDLLDCFNDSGNWPKTTGLTRVNGNLIQFDLIPREDGMAYAVQMRMIDGGWKHFLVDEMPEIPLHLCNVNNWEEVNELLWRQLVA